MLFSDSCKKITIANNRDLDEIKNFLQKFTFKDNDKRSVHEFYCCYVFLVVTLKIKTITFPIVISYCKHKSPDFRLCGEDEKPYLGLEHTTATLEKYKMDETELDKCSEDSLMDLAYYQPGNTPPKKSCIAIKKKSEKLTHPGLGDGEIEKQQAEIILDSIKKKMCLLNKDHYAKYESNELIIEDDTPTSIFGRIHKAITILKTHKQILFSKFPLNYNKIHIYSEYELFYDVFGETNKVDVSKSQLTK